MEVVTRKNRDTGLEEKYIVATGKLLNIETSSKTTKVNKKSYGFFNAIIGGKRSSGIAYAKVAEQVGSEQLVPGAEVQFEALVSDVKSGKNNHWKLALPTTESLSDEISDFVNSL